MDESDKQFLTAKFDGINTRLEGIENEQHEIKSHQQKTCDELDDLKKDTNDTKISVARIDERFENHVDSNKKREITNRERIFMVLGLVSAGVAALTYFAQFS